MKPAAAILFLFILFSGCKRECDCTLPYEIYYFKGQVVNPSMSACSLPLIDFTEDSARIRLLTGMDNVYCIAKGLDPAMNTAGKKLYLSVKKLSAAEDFSCPTSNDFPHVGITDAKNRN